jgi:hypothetical protein
MTNERGYVPKEEKIIAQMLGSDDIDTGVYPALSELPIDVQKELSNLEKRDTTELDVVQAPLSEIIKKPKK